MQIAQLNTCSVLSYYDALSSEWDQESPNYGQWPHLNKVIPEASGFWYLFIHLFGFHIVQAYVTVT